MKYFVSFRIPVISVIQYLYIQYVGKIISQYIFLFYITIYFFIYFLFIQVIVVYTVSGLDNDWMIGERGSQKGRVPITYLELQA